MERTRIISLIEEGFASFPVVALLGARQVGKTTLARYFSEALRQQFSEISFFDLEDPLHQSQLSDPRMALRDLSGLVIIDEVQLSPNLFPVLRVLADRKDNPTRFLLLGSASRELVAKGSESLAGRITFQEIWPFGLWENLNLDAKILWLRGGYPCSYLAKTDKESSDWREQYIRTFLERDIPQLGIKIPALAMRRFWYMLAHYHGQQMNYSEIARSLDISDATVRRYLDILCGTFMVRRVQPWFENISKRQIKSPKIYIRDSGIFHSLLGVFTTAQRDSHPKLGASWEGFALEEIIKATSTREQDTYFWAVHAQGELDLMLFLGGKRIGFEFKFTSNPKVTPSMTMAIDILKLDKLYIVHPQQGNWTIDAKMEVIGIEELIKKL